MDTNIKEIVISSKTHGMHIITIDLADYDLVKNHTWHIDKHPTGILYARNANKVRMHRMILGISDPKVLIDHRDGNGLNNIRSNIRTATKAQNQFNQPVRKDSTSGFRGVSFSRKKWIAYINYNGKRTQLGSFITREEAANAYNTAAIKLHGEYARIN